MEDFAVLAEAWMENDCQATSAVDIDGDCIANYTEFSAMAENWLETITPAPPANLSLTANPSVSLDWDDSPELDVIGYNVYRSTTPGSGYSKLNSSLLTNSNYTDSTAIPEVTYYYVVTAVNVYTNESGYSNEVSKLVIQENTTGFCSVDGSIKTDNPGYTGAGYADTTNASGKGVNWRISVPSNGTYTLTWRFDNGSTSDRTAKLLIDGSTVVSNISFPGTGVWSDWRSVSVNVDLTAGSEKNIRLEATSTGGLANIDYITVGGSCSLTPVSCP
jgi:hypothetical protein